MLFLLLVNQFDAKTKGKDKNCFTNTII